jgi:hypothetical protein
LSIRMRAFFSPILETSSVVWAGVKESMIAVEVCVVEFQNLEGDLTKFERGRGHFETHIYSAYLWTTITVQTSS